MEKDLFHLCFSCYDKSKCPSWKRSIMSSQVGKTVDVASEILQICNSCNISHLVKWITEVSTKWCQKHCSGKKLAELTQSALQQLQRKIVLLSVFNMTRWMCCCFCTVFLCVHCPGLAESFSDKWRNEVIFKKRFPLGACTSTPCLQAVSFPSVSQCWRVKVTSILSMENWPLTHRADLKLPAPPSTTDGPLTAQKLLKLWGQQT